MKFNENSIIGDVVSQNYMYADVFTKHKIDFCCQGNRSIKEACTKANIDAEKVVEDLDNYQGQSNDETIDFKTWPIDLLTDYVEKKHHRYVKAQIPVIQRYLDKIVSVHGGKHPELHEIKEIFDASADDMLSHMDKEESILFPQFRKLAENGANADNSFSSSNPIHKMMEEHTQEGERFVRIDQLSNGYNVPSDGCNTYQVTYNLLKEYERDLHLHIHLENNILFPKALKMEQN